MIAKMTVPVIQKDEFYFVVCGNGSDRVASGSIKLIPGGYWEAVIEYGDRSFKSLAYNKFRACLNVLRDMIDFENPEVDDERQPQCDPDSKDIKVKKKCLNCEGTNLSKKSPNEYHCKDCGWSWRPLFQ